MKQTVSRMAVLLAAVVFSALCGVVQAAGLVFSPGSVSTFATESSKTGTVVGVSGLQWSDFGNTDDYGTKAFIHADVVDAEKTAAVDYDDYWCVPMSDMDALFITGWSRATAYASVDKMVNYFRTGANYKLLQYPTSGPGKYDVDQGKYGAEGIFLGATNWFKATARIDMAPYVNVGNLPTTSKKAAADALATLMGDGGAVVRLLVGFSAPSTTNQFGRVWEPAMAFCASAMKSTAPPAT